MVCFLLSGVQCLLLCLWNPFWLLPVAGKLFIFIAIKSPNQGYNYELCTLISLQYLKEFYIFILYYKGKKQKLVSIYFRLDTVNLNAEEEREFYVCVCFGFYLGSVQ